MTTRKEIYKNLDELIGTRFDEEKIRNAFGDYKEKGQKEIVISQVIGSFFDYSAHINASNTYEFFIKVVAVDGFENIIEIR